MTKMDHSNPYKKPGAGGARDRPQAGGEPWHDLPDGMLEEVIHVEEVQVQRAGRLGPLVDKVLGPKVVERETGREIRKHYE